MRVLWVTDIFPHAGRPYAGEAFAELGKSLARHVDLTVLSPAYRSWWGPKGSFLDHYRAQKPRVEFDGFVAHYPTAPAIPLKFTIAMQAHSMRFGLMGAARRLHEEKPFDLVHAVNAIPPGWAAQAIAQKLGARLVVTCVGSDVMEFPRYPRLRKMLEATFRDSVVTTVSREMIEHVRAFGVTARFIPNGCRIDATPEGPRTRGRVLFVGRLTRVKGLDILVEAMKRVPGATLEVVGGTPDPDAAKWLDGSGAIVRGAISTPELREAMRRADVLCLPSRREGWPLVVMEALAAGLPVVATRVGGIPEIVTSDALGRLVPAENVEALARGLNEALSTSWDRAAIRESVRPYEWDRIAEQYVEVYRSATA